MEEPVLVLGATRLQAEPGGQAQLSITVKNPGHLVESFRLDVVGLDPSWWRCHPPELPVYPGQEGTALVVLSPPARAQAPDDALPFGVRAVSTLDTERSVVEEGDLEVGRILDLQATLEPVTSRGRWRGRHTVTYRNWGNSTVHLRLSVTDKDQQLGFHLVPEQVSVPVGGSARAALRVRPRKPFLRGSPVHRPFQVVGESGTAAPVTPGARTPAARVGVSEPGRPVLDGAIQQVPILSRGVVLLGGLLALLLIGLSALAFMTGKVKGAGTQDAAPETPVAFIAAAPTAGLIQLRWQPTDRAEGYVVDQVAQDTGAPIKAHEIKAGLTGFDDPVSKPLTTQCYVLSAVRGDRRSSATAPACARTKDDSLRPPTQVTVTPDAAGYRVSWKDEPQNGHVLQIDGVPTGQPLLAGTSEVALAIPAGPRCVTVVATREETKSSPPSQKACVQSDGRGVQAQNGGGATPPPAGGGGITTTPPGGTATTGPGVPLKLTGWVAIFGTYQERKELAEPVQRAAAAEGFAASILTLPLPSSLLPGLTNGLAVVVSGLPDEASAQQVCDRVVARQPTTCVTALAQP